MNGDCPDEQVCDFGRSPPVCVKTIVDAPRAAIDTPELIPDAPVDAPADARIPDAAGPPPIVFVQATNSKPSGLTSTVTLPANVGVNDAIIACLNFPSASGATLTSITDTLGNTYVILVGPYLAAGDLHYIAATYGSAAGADTVTLHFSSSPSTGGGTDLLIGEYSGLAVANAFDVEAHATANGTAMDSGTAATTFGHELIVGYAEAPSAAVGTGFAQRALQSGNLIEDRVVNATGTYDATATTGSGAWTMMMATFKGR